MRSAHPNIGPCQAIISLRTKVHRNADLTREQERNLPFFLLLLVRSKVGITASGYKFGDSIYNPAVLMMMTGHPELQHH